MVLDIIQRVEHHPLFSERDLVGLKSRFLVMRWIISRDFERDPVRHTGSPSVNPLARGPASDSYGRVFHPGPAVRGAMHQGVRQKLLIVTRPIVCSLVSPPRLSPVPVPVPHLFHHL